MRTLDKIITEVSCKYGAPMGRCNVGHILNTMGEKLYDSAIPLSEGYDRGGAYWGTGGQLRVRYTKSLTYIFFYRKH